MQLNFESKANCECFQLLYVLWTSAVSAYGTNIISYSLSHMCYIILKLDTGTYTTLSLPYSKAFKLLSKLSLEALNSNQLVSTSEDIKAAFPDMVANSYH